jgi:putative ABC transport system substrate-binding protein
MTDVDKGFSDFFATRKIPVEIMWRDLNRDPARMSGFLDEIRSIRPDLIYTWGTSVTLGVTGPYDKVIPGVHITDIPVVFTLVASPVLAKIVADVNAPGRNVTGVTHVGPTEAQIRAMAQYRPFQTLGVLYTPTERNSVVTVEEIRRLGLKMGFHTIERTFHVDTAGKPNADGAAEMVQELKTGGAQWLYLPPDSYLGTQAEGLIIPAATALGLPTFASTEQLMQAGALSGLVSKYYSVGQFTAHKAEQILVNRVAPGAVPVEPLKRFSYQISMPVSRRLNLPPPLPMLSYAELISVDPTAR